jgi:4-hydroxy-3-methylbut-2-enyl diphosphate reductase
VEEVAITDEDEYFPTPRNLRELLGAIDDAATASLGGQLEGRPAPDERTIAAADVLADL